MNPFVIINCTSDGDLCPPNHAQDLSQYHGSPLDIQSWSPPSPWLWSSLSWFLPGTSLTPPTHTSSGTFHEEDGDGNRVKPPKYDTSQCPLRMQCYPHEYHDENIVTLEDDKWFPVRGEMSWGGGL